MQEGTIITDMEGIDLGPEGAVVVEVKDGTMEVVRLDTHEYLSVELGDIDFATEEPSQGEGTNPYLYDPDAMDSPEIDNIRTLPTYRGPRDPNNPSSITDVSWRPENYYKRHVNKYGGANPMRRRNADLYPSMDPIPHKETLPKQYHQDYGLPRRMRTERWEDGDEYKLEELIALATDFWRGYREKRMTLVPQRGDRQSMEVYQWGIMFMKRNDLDHTQMEELYRFMVDTDIIPQSEFNEFRDALDTYAVNRYDHV